MFELVDSQPQNAVIKVIGVGGGWNSWRATSGAAGTTKDGGGVIVVEDDDFRLSGSETFLRFTLEFYW